MARGAVRGPRVVSSIRGLAGAQARAMAWHRRDQSCTKQVDAVRKGLGHGGSNPPTSTILIRLIATHFVMVPMSWQPLPAYGSIRFLPTYGPRVTSPDREPSPLAIHADNVRSSFESHIGTSEACYCSPQPNHSLGSNQQPAQSLISGGPRA